MDNGHSFDSILFYGNEQLLFQVEILLFLCLIIASGNLLFAMLFLGIISQVKQTYFPSKICRTTPYSLVFSKKIYFSDTKTHDAIIGEKESVKSNVNWWTISHLKWSYSHRCYDKTIDSIVKKIQSQNKIEMHNFSSSKKGSPRVFTVSKIDLFCVCVLNFFVKSPDSLDNEDGCEPPIIWCIPVLIYINRMKFRG